MPHREFRMNADSEGPFSTRELAYTLGAAVLGVFFSYGVVLLLLLPVVHL